MRSQVHPLGTLWRTLGVTDAQLEIAGTSSVLKFAKSSGRQLDHRGTLTCTAAAPGASHAQLELQGKFTESMRIVPVGSDAAIPREVFR